MSIPLSAEQGGNSIVAANRLHPEKDGADGAAKTDGSGVEPLTIRDRLEVERELAQDITATHRKRTRQGMFGGALTSYETCSFDGHRWRCKWVRWAEERLAEQASELARTGLPVEVSMSGAETSVRGGSDPGSEQVQPSFREGV